MIFLETKQFQETKLDPSWNKGLYFKKLIGYLPAIRLDHSSSLANKNKQGI